MVNSLLWLNFHLIVFWKKGSCLIAVLFEPCQNTGESELVITTLFVIAILANQISVFIWITDKSGFWMVKPQGVSGCWIFKIQEYFVWYSDTFFWSFLYRLSTVHSHSTILKHIKEFVRTLPTWYLNQTFYYFDSQMQFNSIWRVRTSGNLEVSQTHLAISI